MNQERIARNTPGLLTLIILINREAHLNFITCLHTFSIYFDICKIGEAYEKSKCNCVAASSANKALYLPDQLKTEVGERIATLILQKYISLSPLPVCEKMLLVEIPLRSGQMYLYAEV